MTPRFSPSVRGAEKRRGQTLGTLRVTPTLKQPHRARDPQPIAEPHAGSSFHDYYSPLFTSTLQITVRLILLNPLRKEENKDKTKERKQPAGGRAAIYQFYRVSLCLRLIPRSHPSLRSPCYEAIMWIFMKSDLYQRKTRAVQNPSPVLPLYQLPAATLHLVLLHPSLFLLLICISHITSLPPTLFLHLHLQHFFFFSCTHAQISASASLDGGASVCVRVCLTRACARLCVCVYKGKLRIKGHKLGLSLQVCENEACANRMLLVVSSGSYNLQPEIEFLAARGPHRVGYRSNNERKAWQHKHTLAYSHSRTRVSIFKGMI